MFLVFQIKKFEVQIEDLIKCNNELKDEIRRMQTAVPVEEVPQECASMASSTLELPKKRRRSL